jgi:hypothetical protein
VSPSTPRPVHLVGSVPLASAEDVFEQVSRRIGPLIARIPDGETGERLQFIGWQEKVMQSTPGLQPAGEWQIAGNRTVLYGLAPGTHPEQITLGPLGYARAALDSFETFSRLQLEGKVAANTRMQVSLPTPLTVMIKFAARNSLRALWPVYERQMLTELKEILRVVPPESLAIQWDVAPEVHTVLEQPESELTRLITRPDLVAAIARITDSVPAEAQVGWHLCYGDPGHKHIVEPQDMAIMVDLANDLSAATRRAVDWVHMPVPRGRNDAQYFAPLARLRLGPTTVPIMGLVHTYDGVDGAEGRAERARVHLPKFGVATECGLGRRAPESIPGLMDLHREIALAV